MLPTSSTPMPVAVNNEFAPPAAAVRVSDPSPSSKSSKGHVTLPPLRTGHAARLAAARRGIPQSHMPQSGTSNAVSRPSVRSMASFGDMSALGLSSRMSPSEYSAFGAVSTRRGHRNPVKVFNGERRAEPNSALPPAQSALPDMSNWRTPHVRTESVASRMHGHQITSKQRFESPFKCENLRQPEPLRCTPVPQSDNADPRNDALDKPTVLRATVKSLPRNVSPLLQQKSYKELTVPEMVRVLHDVARLSDREAHSMSPAQLAERDRRLNDPMDSSSYTMAQMEAFERTVADKLAFGRYLSNNKRERLPVMVLRHFRHQLMDESQLVRALRKMPLRRIEEELEALGPRTINAHQWNALLVRLVGDSFSRLEAHTLFSFFDTDVDGDVDQRELCNGFVYIRSQDGPMLAVLQRCAAFLQQNIKDTRLTFISRFELVLVAEAVSIASEAHLSAAERAELREALQQLLSSFSTNRRGEFPFDEVRGAVLGSAPIVKAVKSFHVPRDPDLYASPLSVYFRNGDMDDGEQPFRLMMSLKALDKSLRAAAAASSAGVNAGSSAASVAVSPSLRVGLGQSRGNLDVSARDLDDAHIESDDSDYEAETTRERGTLGMAEAAAQAAARGIVVGANVGLPKALVDKDGADPEASISINGPPGDAARRRPTLLSVTSANDDALSESVSRGRSEQSTPRGSVSLQVPLRSKASKLMSFRRPGFDPQARALAVADANAAASQETDELRPPPGRDRRATIAAAPGGSRGSARGDLDDPPPTEDELRLQALPVQEPEAPEYYTLRGVLYRKTEGDEARPYWVPGMPTNVRYSEPRK